MIEKIPGNIKNIYKISSIVTILIFIIGIIVKKPELYFAFTVGSLISMLIIYILTIEVYRMVYIYEKKQGRNPFFYFIRMGIYILALLFVVYGTRKFFPHLVRKNIIFTGLGFLNFKISLFITEKVKKFAKKN